MLPRESGSATRAVLGFACGRRGPSCPGLRRSEPQPPVVVGVAVQEFEAWLLADEAPLRQCLGFARDPLPKPESLAPGEAKAIIEDLLAKKSGAADERYAIRLLLAEALDLALVASRCKSFQRFRSHLHTTAKVG
jgi:hypothetical protein